MFQVKRETNCCGGCRAVDEQRQHSSNASRTILRCCVCQKPSGSEEKLRAHLCQIHLNWLPYGCAFCPGDSQFQGASSTQIASHISQAHPGQPVEYEYVEHGNNEDALERMAEASIEALRPRGPPQTMYPFGTPYRPFSNGRGSMWSAFGNVWQPHEQFYQPQGEVCQPQGHIYQGYPYQQGPLLQVTPYSGLPALPAPPLTSPNATFQSAETPSSLCSEEREKEKTESPTAVVQKEMCLENPSKNVDKAKKAKKRQKKHSQKSCLVCKSTIERSERAAHVTLEHCVEFEKFYKCAFCEERYKKPHGAKEHASREHTMTISNLPNTVPEDWLVDLRHQEFKQQFERCFARKPTDTEFESQFASKRKKGAKKPAKNVQKHNCAICKSEILRNMFKRHALQHLKRPIFRCPEKKCDYAQSESKNLVLFHLRRKHGLKSAKIDQIIDEEHTVKKELEDMLKRCFSS